MRKKIAAAMLAGMLLISLGACYSREEENSSSLVQEEPSEPSSSSEDAGKEEEKQALYRQIVSDYGARECTDEQGNLYWEPTIVSLYYGDSWTDVNQLTPGQYFSWYFSWMLREDLTDEQQREKYESPFGENTGWFFPQEIYESTVMRYFDVTEETLRSDPAYYHAEYEGYNVGTGPGKGETPHITLEEVQWEEDVVHLTLQLQWQFTQEPKKAVLSAKVAEDGSFRYQSFVVEDIQE